jgi:hypothetical protein
LGPSLAQAEHFIHPFPKNVAVFLYKIWPQFYSEPFNSKVLAIDFSFHHSIPATLLPKMFPARITLNGNFNGRQSTNEQKK